MKPKFRILFFALGTALVATSAQAETYSWSNTVTSPGIVANWSAGTGWNAVPVSASDTTLSFGWSAFTTNSTAQTNTLTNDIANPFLLNVLTFGGVTPTAGSGSSVALLNIAGSPLSLVSNGSATPVVNLNTNRSNGQVVTYNVQSNVNLGAGTLFTGNGTANFNFSGIVGGTSGFTKSGTSTLTLSNGSNDFTGGVTLSAGGLVLGNVSALGSNTVSVTGNSTISATSGIVSNTMNVSDGVTLGLRGIGATNSTTTFSSAITGNVGVTLVQGAASGITVALSSTANTFTGNLTLPGGTGANDFISFNSIGDGGSIVFNRLSWRANAIYTGASNLSLATRNISLSSTFGGLGNTPGLDGGGNPINMFSSSGTGVVTISSDMAIASSANNGVFYFGGSNTGNNTFSGLIADNPGTGVLGIGKWDAGKWILSNANNSFNGNIYLFNGTLSASNIQALGNGSVIQIGQANTATLEYTGSANASTGKQIVIGDLSSNSRAGGATILNNGTGTLSFTNATFNSLTVPWTGTFASTTIDRTLTLGGSNMGANTISGEIRDNTPGAAQVSVSKTDAGSWVLGGDNSYTGTTSVTGGTLLINGSTSSTSVVSVGANGTLGGSGVVGGNTTITGNLKPGNSAGVLEFGGNLTLAAGSSTTMEIGGITRDAQYDGVDVAGAMAYGGALNIDLTTIFGSDTYTFDLFQLANAPTGSFSAVNLTGTYGNSTFTNNSGVWSTTTNDGNESWTFTQSTGDLTLSVIPEPSTALLGAIGALALLRRRR